MDVGVERTFSRQIFLYVPRYLRRRTPSPSECSVLQWSHPNPAVQVASRRNHGEAKQLLDSTLRAPMGLEQWRQPELPSLVPPAPLGRPMTERLPANLPRDPTTGRARLSGAASPHDTGWTHCYGYISPGLPVGTAHLFSWDALTLAARATSDSSEVDHVTTPSQRQAGSARFTSRLSEPL